MTTTTEQQYIVHLDIRAAAVDPYEAVQEVLEQVQFGGLRVACSVEAVGSGGEPFTVPTADWNSSNASRVAVHAGANAYCGEFLG